MAKRQPIARLELVKYGDNWNSKDGQVLFCDLQSLFAIPPRSRTACFLVFAEEHSQGYRTTRSRPTIDGEYWEYQRSDGTVCIFYFSADRWLDTVASGRDVVWLVIEA